MTTVDAGAARRGQAAALVAGQVALLGAQAVLRRGSRPASWPRSSVARAAACALAAAGTAILLSGAGSLGRGLTASPLPNDHAQLQTDGLYAAVRHPIYTGVIALSLARTLQSRDWRQGVLTVLLSLLLRGKSAFEEDALRRRFPGYRAYAAQTPRFVPRYGSVRTTRATAAGD